MRFPISLLLTLGYLTSSAIAQPPATPETVQIVSSHKSDSPAAHGLSKLAEALAKRDVAVKRTDVAARNGTITLRRAQGMADAEARHAELEKAEKTFLAVQGIAGDDESFRLHVGQVYYWLGKHDEGKREFAQLLESTNRSFGSLLRVASVLREIGSYGEARTCIEEAYEKAPDDASRHAAAYMRSKTCTDAKDGISWLERCDQGQASIRAGLQAAWGREAVKVGDKDEAAGHFRQAVAIYDGMNVTSSSLNNSGLVCLALYRLTTDPKALKHATTRLEKGAALEPDNAILLANAADALIQTAVRDLARADRELAGDASFDDFDALNYLVRDEAELEQLRDKARNHKGLRLARAYLDKATVMAPRSPNAYYRALRVDAFLRDEKALRQLADRAKSATFDLENQAERYLQFFRFEEDSTKQSQSVRNAAEAAEDVARYRRAGNRIAFAVSVGKLLQYMVTLHDISDVNADELVQLAEESHAASPTLGTYSLLASALVFRAHQTLSKSFPEYAEAGEMARRSLSPAITVALVLSHPTELGEAARQNPDVQRMANLLKERGERFPSSRGTLSWAVLQALESPVTSQLAKHIKSNQVKQLIRDNDRLLEPYSAPKACYEYWARLAGGNAQDARAPLQQVIDLGVPVPLYLLGWDKD